MPSYISPDIGFYDEVYIPRNGVWHSAYIAQQTFVSDTGSLAPPDYSALASAYTVIGFFPNRPAGLAYNSSLDMVISAAEYAAPSTGKISASVLPLGTGTKREGILIQSVGADNVYGGNVVVVGTTTSETFVIFEYQTRSMGSDILTLAFKTLDATTGAVGALTNISASGDGMSGNYVKAWFNAGIIHVIDDTHYYQINVSTKVVTEGVLIGGTSYYEGDIFVSSDNRFFGYGFTNPVGSTWNDRMQEYVVSGTTCTVTTRAAIGDSIKTATTGYNIIEQAGVLYFAMAWNYSQTSSNYGLEIRVYNFTLATNTPTVIFSEQFYNLSGIGTNPKTSSTGFVVGEHNGDVYVVTNIKDTYVDFSVNHTDTYHWYWTNASNTNKIRGTLTAQISTMSCLLDNSNLFSVRMQLSAAMATMSASLFHVPRHILLAIQIAHELEAQSIHNDDLVYTLTLNGVLVVPMFWFTLRKQIESGLHFEEVTVAVPTTLIEYINPLLGLSFSLKKVVAGNESEIVAGTLDLITLGANNESFLVLTSAPSNPIGSKSIAIENTSLLRSSTNEATIRADINTNISIGDTVTTNDLDITASRVVIHVGTAARFMEVSG